MFAGSRRLQVVEPLAPHAEAFADALIARGDGAAAAEVLRLAARHEVDETVALRRAERALARGDAKAALDALVPVWEAGDASPEVEARLALAALALGLYDVAATLTDGAETLAHAVVRFIVEAWDEAPAHPLPLDRAEGVWALRSALRQLEACGRVDLAAAAYVAAIEARPGIAGQLGPAPTPPAERPRFRAPMQGRAAFCAEWRGPAADAVFSWAWSVARQVIEGERVLLLSPQPGPLRGLFAHGRTVAVAPGAGPGVDVIGAPEALPVAPNRFHHVVAIHWLEAGPTPLAALSGAAQALGNGGQLHLLCVGPRAEGDFDVRLSPGATERLIGRAGLTFDGRSSRDGRGIEVDAAQAEVHLLRAERWLL